jgi:hypothetical protein
MAKFERWLLLIILIVVISNGAVQWIHFHPIQISSGIKPASEVEVITHLVAIELTRFFQNLESNPPNDLNEAFVQSLINKNPEMDFCRQVSPINMETATRIIQFHLCLVHPPKQCQSIMVAFTNIIESHDAVDYRAAFFLRNGKVVCVKLPDTVVMSIVGEEFLARSTPHFYYWPYYQFFEHVKAREGLNHP